MKENNKQKTTLFKKTSCVLLLIIGAIMITSVIGSVFTTFRNENILKVDIKAWEITDDGVKVLGSWSLIKTIIILALGTGEFFYFIWLILLFEMPLSSQGRTQ